MGHEISRLTKRYAAGFIALFMRLRSGSASALKTRQENNHGKRGEKGPRSLANRILLLQFTWAVAVYILVIAAMWYAANSVIESTLRRQAEGWIGKLDEMGIPLFVSNMPDKLRDSINDLRNFPEVVAVRYLDVSGDKVIADYQRKDVEAATFLTIDAAFLKINSADEVGVKRPILFEMGRDSRVKVAAPMLIKSIESDGLFNFSLDGAVRERRETIGYVSVVLDYSAATESLNRSLIYASLIIAALMFLAAIIGRVMVRWALRPLLRLEEPLTRLANGETDVTVESSGDREIAQIGRALNTTIGALRERDETLRRMANHDALTGLINRKHFVELLEDDIERIGREGGSSALFFIDLDRFKYVNDTYGHAAGDRLLVQIAELLRSRLRDDDILARLGGDEFVALIRNSNRKSAQDIATSLLTKMQDFTFYEGVDALKIYFSVGITVISDGRATPHHYLKQADEAVHEAKSQGRNRYFMYEPDITTGEGSIDGGWYERIKLAIEQEQFRFYYQPLLGLKGQSSKIHEVLLRLPDARHGMIVPGGFFPAAERFGLMPEMDRFVLRKAVQALANISDADVIFSLNFSGHIFEDGDFVSYVEQLLVEYRVSPNRLIFEIGEQIAVRHIEHLKPLVQRIVAMGIRFAIDDFGAGFASFNYVKQFPVQCLKINGALIERVALDSVDRITVTTIAALANELGMETVAKFVPNEESLNILRDIGIDYAQGDYIAEPDPNMERTVRPKLSVVR